MAKRIKREKKFFFFYKTAQLFLYLVLALACSQLAYCFSSNPNFIEKNVVKKLSTVCQLEPSHHLVVLVLLIQKHILKRGKLQNYYTV